MRLFMSAFLMMATVSAAHAFQLPNDYGRFGPDETIALARVENEPAMVQVNAYGDAPVVKFLMSAEDVRACAVSLTEARNAQPDEAATAKPDARCTAYGQNGAMDVFKRDDNRFDIEFSNGVPGNIVAVTLDNAGLAKAIEVFQIAASG